MRLSPIIPLSRMEWMKGSCKRSKHYSEGEGEGEGSDDNEEWSCIELPRDVTDLIIETLVKQSTMRDAIRCSVVCKRWNNIARMEAPVEPPWITVVDVLSVEKADIYTDCYSLWGNESCHYRLSGAPTTICTKLRSIPPSKSNPSFWKLRSYLLASSQGGWLLRGCHCHLLICYSDVSFLSDALHPISLYNPFTNICFDLPNYVKPVETCCRRGSFQDITQCSVFTHNLYPGYYFVVLSCLNNLSLSRVDNGEGNWFHFHNRRHSSYSSVLFRTEEQCLYALDSKAGLDIFALECLGNDQEFHLIPMYFVQVALFSDQFITTNLVESRGHIIVVICINDTVEVYKLDNKDKSCVSRVHSIGDEAFFLGGPSFCVSATSFSKVQPNCIYYHSSNGFTTISLEGRATKFIKYNDVKTCEEYYPLCDSKLIAPPPLSSSAFQN